MMGNWLLLMDPPDHTRLRSLVHKAFTPRMVAQLRASIQQLTDGLLGQAEQQARDQGAVDLMAAFAYPLPVAVICALLGVPQEDYVQFHGWSDAIARSFDLTDDAAVYDRAAVAAHGVDRLSRRLLAKRRADPQNDLISALVSLESEGDKLTKAELFATCALLLIAGHETTVNLIGNGTLALLRHPDQWRALQENPALAGVAVEELLRYDSPVQMTARSAHERLNTTAIRSAVGRKWLSSSAPPIATPPASRTRIGWISAAATAATCPLAAAFTTALARHRPAWKARSPLAPWPGVCLRCAWRLTKSRIGITSCCAGCVRCR